MSENLFDQERAAVARLTDAVRGRVAAEAELTATFQTAMDKIDREATRARKANTAARQSELGSIDEAHTAAVNDLTTKFDTEQSNADRGYEERQKSLTEKYKAAEQRGRTEYNDRIWHIDSMLEAGHKAAREKMEALQRKAGGAKERIAKLWTETEPLLVRGRVTRTDIESADPFIMPEDSDPITWMNKAVQNSQNTHAALAALKSPGLGKVPGLALFLLIGFGLGAAIGFSLLDPTTAIIVTVVVGLLAGIGLWLVVRMKAQKTTKTVGQRLGQQLAEAAAAAKFLHEHAAREHLEEREKLGERHTLKKEETDKHYMPMFEKQKIEFEAKWAQSQVDYKALCERLRKQRATEMKAEEESYNDVRGKAEKRLDAELKAAETLAAEKTGAATAVRDAAWNAMANEWRNANAAVVSTFGLLRQEGADVFPSWGEIARADRPVAARVPPGVRCGDWSVDMEKLPDGIPPDPQLAPSPELNGLVPAFMPFPDRCSVLVRARDEGRTAAVAALQAMMLRFLTGLPPGKVRFTIIDPVGLGDNFAAFMHLADFDEKLVTSQIWTEPRQIEDRLIDLTDHIASVIQKYLRNQYKTIEEYNLAAGEVAEPYRVLVVANFPQNFTPDAAKRLVSIANSGPSCGVCTLMSVDTRAAMPRDFNLSDLELASFTLAWKEGAFVPKDATLATFPLALDQPPDVAAVGQMVQRVGKASKEAARVEVPFDFIAPKPAEEWKSSASKGFEVPVGRAGATRRQSFILGRGTAQHALVAGKTGSGKSTLLHALITNMALLYSPDEAEMYLIDFKEGVEFQWYATYCLPHARVVAIQSEREFGLSVLQRLDGILRERGEKFRDAGANDLAGYRAATPNEKTPRILLIVDEFQQFFTEDDKLAQETALLLDRLVRQGRAFGMHVLLGSQTLGGAYSLARSTIDQMAVRVALQCSETDAQLILSKDNTAARLLSRPGEAIYNDQNGLVEGNDPFQVVWLTEEKREQILSDLHKRGGDRYPPPLVFSGNEAADMDANKVLIRLLDSPKPSKAPAAFLGDPVAIKEPTAAVFRAIGGANLLVIGQNEPAARGLFVSSILGLAAQVEVPAPIGEASSPAFTILDGTPDDADDAEYMAKLAVKVPGAIAVPRSGLPTAIGDLAAELDRRQKGETTDRSPRFLFILGIHRFRELRKAEDDFGFRRGAEREATPAERFATIFREGPALGIHVIVWCDSLTSLNRAFERPQLREFTMRVLFQMSAADSSTLMDTPLANRLARNRALYLQEEQERPEKFRPYALPPTEWLDAACEKLRARVGLNAEPAAV